jgi:ATP-dependent Clp protease ATP-binding subunit ClpA
MRLDRLTNKFQLALSDAQSLALGHDNQFIEPLHLMSALLKQEGGSVAPLLSSAGADVAALRTQIDQAIDRLPQVEGSDGDTIKAFGFLRGKAWKVDANAVVGSGRFGLELALFADRFLAFVAHFASFERCAPEHRSQR